jgi:putative SOS response-associated peptidase YedK
MCGRAKLVTDVSEIKLAFRIPGPPINVPPLWNGAPTHDFPVMRRHPETGARALDLLRWGLVPRWARDGKAAYSTINAKAETVTSKPAFRDPWRRGQRCIVPLDAFYEWEKRPDGTKQPYAIGRKDSRLMAVAGLWEAVTLPDGGILRSFTILTTTANSLLSQLHNRMPVILAEADIPSWLGEVPATEAELAALLRPCPDDLLMLTPVDPRMSNVRNQDPAFCQPYRP